MARKERKDNGKLRELMEEYGVKTMEDVHNFVKMLAADPGMAGAPASKRICHGDSGCGALQCSRKRYRY